MAFEVNNQVVRDAIAKRGWPEPAPGELHIFGARGAVPWSGAPNYLTIKVNTPDEWNDTIGMFGTAFGIWKGTVDPGLYYTKDPLNTSGCAHLQDGVWQYQLGDHKGHQALVQAAPVTVWRDADKDSGQDQGEKVETGWFGINIHGGSGDVIGEWSAGCQVIWDNFSYGDNWNAFLSEVKASGQPTWYYYLLDAQDLAP